MHIYFRNFRRPDGRETDHIPPYGRPVRRRRAKEKGGAARVDDVVSIDGSGPLLARKRLLSRWIKESALSVRCALYILICVRLKCKLPVVRLARQPRGIDNPRADLCQRRYAQVSHDSRDAYDAPPFIDGESRPGCRCIERQLRGPRWLVKSRHGRGPGRLFDDRHLGRSLRRVHHGLNRRRQGDGRCRLAAFSENGRQYLVLNSLFKFDYVIFVHGLPNGVHNTTAIDWIHRLLQLAQIINPQLSHTRPLESRPFRLALGYQCHQLFHLLLRVLVRLDIQKLGP